MWELGYRESWVPKKWCFWSVVLEKTLESSLGSKEIKPVHPRGNHYLIFTGRTDDEAETPVLWTTWCKELTHLKRSWCWERLKAGGEGDERGWDHWTASPTGWTWVWASSGSWWRTGKPGVLAAAHGIAKSQTRLSNWTDRKYFISLKVKFIVKIWILFCEEKEDLWREGRPQHLFHRDQYIIKYDI